MGSLSGQLSICTNFALTLRHVVGAFVFLFSFILKVGIMGPMSHVRKLRLGEYGTLLSSSKMGAGIHNQLQNNATEAENLQRRLSNYFQNKV